MAATIETMNNWFAGAVGRPMNPDNAYGLQCKDTADDYCIALWGNWYDTIRPGNGSEVFNNANPNYFTKVKNNPNDPNQIPPRGAIINWAATRAVPEGHVAVVESADANGLTVIQQDGYLQYPTRRVRTSYTLATGAPVVGWLIPKFQESRKNATDEEIKAAYWQYLGRPADNGGIVHYRNYDISFVRTDLQKSQEYRDRQASLARAAAEKADAEKRAAALRAEQQRVAEEKAAAERMRVQAEQAARAAKEAEERIRAEQARIADEKAKEAEKKRLEDLAKQNESDPFDVPTVTPPAPTPTPQPVQPKGNILVRILFELFIKVFKKS